MKLPLDGWKWGSGEHPASWSPTPAPGTWKDGPSTLCRPLHLHLHRVKPPPFKDPASSCPVSPSPASSRAPRPWELPQSWSQEA